ncbi:LysM domain-containing protein [Oryzomicrobium sp.]|uniref:LysM peptidoglycan-binding domain-containing protein n=1 Tax=Oryzomicrobium sp. TaxID=1911578 RepID=UPI0025EC06D1|nr:LysM domain-containing protein [Oryzomicrobium sp.]MCE1242242.1 LysM peptidoglycan-binding domain-containing protein [Oryzomicrobium sp.]
MKRIIAALTLGMIAATASAQATAPLTLADGAPDRHVVVKGDTLWGISGKFLQQPWRWPEIWRLNKDEVKNPHRIYPGDIIVLGKGADGRPQLILARRIGEGGSTAPKTLKPTTYITNTKDAIPSIPPREIEPFLSKPMVVTADSLTEAPRIIAPQEGRVMLGGGDSAIVSGIPEGKHQWLIYRPGKKLIDPDTKELLGYEAIYLGTARVRKEGEPAVVDIVTANQEVGRGDRLTPYVEPDIITYAPRGPEANVSAKVVAIYGGLAQAGRYSMIVLNKGSQDGLAVGHVLALYRSTQLVQQRNEAGRKETVEIPENRNGLAFVFRVMDRVAYALVLDATLPVEANDTLRNP